MPVKSQILQACIKILVYSVLFIVNNFNEILRWLHAYGFVITPFQSFRTLLIRWHGDVAFCQELEFQQWPTIFQVLGNQQTYRLVIFLFIVTGG